MINTLLKRGCSHPTLLLSPCLRATSLIPNKRLRVLPTFLWWGSTLWWEEGNRTLYTSITVETIKWFIHRKDLYFAYPSPKWNRQDSNLYL